MSKKRIVSVMPIKLNNERLPGKNTMMLGDKPLIRYELDTLLSIKEISDIYVFCSQDSIKKYLPQSVRYLKRPEYLDLPTSNFNQIFDEFLKIIDADIYVYAHATAPFVKKESIMDSFLLILFAISIIFFFHTSITKFNIFIIS